MNSPRTTCLKIFAALALGGTLLASCAVSPEGPVSSGASHGSLGSRDMSNYYYKKDAGWTYAYRNVEHIYDQYGLLQSTLEGAPDTVRTMGFDGMAPTGDSLFRVQITYRVLAQYAGRDQIDMWYACRGNSQNGAFIDGPNPTAIPNATNMAKRPRPVSTDTILAGVVGRVRTVCDDFTNQGTYVWQTDTLWFSSTGDSVFIWERFPGATTLSKERLIFCRNFVDNVNWCYDLIGGSTFVKVTEDDLPITVPAGIFLHTMKEEVYTPSVYDNMPIHEHKWYSCWVGNTKEYDDWYVTTDGVTRNKEDFNRVLVSLTHN